MTALPAVATYMQSLKQTQRCSAVATMQGTPGAGRGGGEPLQKEPTRSAAIATYA